MVKRILISPIGFTKNYIEISYKKEDSEIRDWISSRALLKLKYADNWNDVHIILIYPDNKGANISINKGWEEYTVNDKIIPAKDAVIKVFESCISINHITVDEEMLEEDLSKLMKDLHDKILDISDNEQTEIIFDLTHSYRHISIAGFIQSVFISDLKERFKLIGVYYGMLKLPADTNSVSTFVKLDELINIMTDIGTIGNAIQELRPTPLFELSRKYNKINQESRGKFRYIRAMGNSISTLTNLLSNLQYGLCNTEVLTELENMINSDISQPISDFEAPYTILYSHIIDTVGNFLLQFKSGDNWVAYFERQFILSKIMLDNQSDVLRAYAFMREGFTSYLIHVLEMNSLIDNDVEGGDKDNRDEVEDKLFTQFKSENEVLRKLKGLMRGISNERNSLAHVYTAREGKTINFEKRMNRCRKELDNLLDFISENNDEIILELSNLYVN